jgi:hypothetical protein
MNTDQLLQIRLRNCLQTILDFNESMEAKGFGFAFSGELKLLREFLGRLDSMVLSEADVLRIEDATAVFFGELRGFFDQEHSLQNSGAQFRVQ